MVFSRISDNKHGQVPHSCALDKILSYLNLLINHLVKLDAINILSNAHERGKDTDKS